MQIELKNDAPLWAKLLRGFTALLIIMPIFIAKYLPPIPDEVEKLFLGYAIGIVYFYASNIAINMWMRKYDKIEVIVRPQLKLKEKYRPRALMLTFLGSFATPWLCFLNVEVAIIAAGCIWTVLIVLSRSKKWMECEDMSEVPDQCPVTVQDPRIPS